MTDTQALAAVLLMSLGRSQRQVLRSLIELGYGDTAFPFASYLSDNGLRGLYEVCPDGRIRIRGEVVETNESVKALVKKFLQTRFTRSAEEMLIRLEGRRKR